MIYSGRVKTFGFLASGGSVSISHSCCPRKQDSPLPHSLTAEGRMATQHRVGRAITERPGGRAAPVHPEGASAPSPAELVFCRLYPRVHRPLRNTLEKELVLR